MLSATLLAVWASLLAQPGSAPEHAAALSAAVQAVLGHFGPALPLDWGLLQVVPEPVLADADQAAVLDCLLAAAHLPGAAVAAAAAAVFWQMLAWQGWPACYDWPADSAVPWQRH